MTIIKNYKDKLVNFLFLFLPLSFIGGNSLININIILIIITSLYFYKREVFKISYNIYDKILLAFFFVLILTGSINSLLIYFPEESIYAKEVLIKSFFFLRFLLIYFILRYLILNDILKLKFFFISAAICSLFVSLDVILQFLTGRDVFGYESFDRRNPGPFNDEAISGTYLQRFSLFIFFLIPIFFIKFQNHKNSILILIIFFITFCAVLFSGNKFPFIMFVMSILILFILFIRSKKLIFVMLVSCPLVFLLFFKYNFQVKNNFGGFFKYISQVEIYTSSVIENIRSGKEIEIPNVWIKEIHNGILAFNTKKIFGGGIKSYKITCPKISKYPCNSHPHQSHVEMLVSVGLTGYLLLLILFFKFSYNVFIKNYHKFSKNDQMLLILFFTLIFIEVFPLRTSGSFFSTTNASYFFIIMSIYISLGLKKIKKNYG